MKKLLSLILVFAFPALLAASGLQPIGGVTVVYSGADVTAPTVTEGAGTNIDVNGTLLTIAFSESVSEGAGYNDGDWTLSCSTTGPLTVAHTTGDGTASWGLSITGGPVQDSGTDTCTLDWAGTADGVEDGSGNDLAAIDPVKSIVNNSTQGAASYACSSCTPGDPSDILCEDFEDVSGGYQCSDWTENTSGGTINEDFATPFAFTGTGSDALDIDVTTYTSDAFVYKTFTDTQTFYFTAFFMIDTESLADSGVASLVCFTDSTVTTPAACIYLAQSSGTLYFTTWDSVNSFTVGTTAVSLDTEYELKLSINTTGAGSTDIIKLEVGTNTDVNITNVDLGNNTVGAILIGNVTGIGSSANYNFVIDSARMDNDTAF